MTATDIGGLSSSCVADVTVRDVTPPALTCPSPTVLVPLSNRRFRARAERNGTGNGRVYTVEYAYTNAAGVETQSKCEIEVPHEPTQPVVKGTYAWTRTLADTTCSEACGSALVLEPQDYAAWGTAGSMLRVS